MEEEIEEVPEIPKVREVRISAGTPKREINHKTKLELAVLFGIMAILTISLIPGPTISAYISQTAVTQQINLKISRSQEYELTTNSTELFDLTSLRLSGSVEGDGAVQILLEDEENDKTYIVWTNVRKTIPPPAITGMEVKNQSQAQTPTGSLLGSESKEGKYLTLIAGRLRKESFAPELADDEELVTGTFTDACIETCSIQLPLSSEIKYRLLFLLEEGVDLEITEILHTEE